jgi:hypothetical protein
MTKPGFLHLTGWEHPDEPVWYNEVSLWAANGAIMEGIINNFELASTRLLRICPTSGKFEGKVYPLEYEQKTLAEPCPQCGFHFPVATETPTSTSVFKDLSG